MTTYPDSVEYLYSLGNELRGARLGLERIRAVLAALGDPQRDCRFIHVAGTNGKGSTCAMIESALRASGVRTGLFTSPHLVEPTERIRIDGRPVSDEQFAGAFHSVHRAAESLVRGEELDAHPSYFETVTAMAMLLFRDQGVDTVVLETGLGGRLDATNIVSPGLCVITPVDYDHEAWLGSSLEAIAGEKAGIIKPGVPVVISRQWPQAMRILEARAATVGAPVVRMEDWRIESLQINACASRFLTAAPRAWRVECPLAGEHQVDNALTAVAALDRWGVPEDAVSAGIRETRWPGRLETVAQRPRIILDGAHNPAAIRALAAHVQRFYGGRRLWLIFGAMRDKSLAEIADTLAPLASEVILTAPDSPRAAQPESLRALFGHPSTRVAARLAQALEWLPEVGPQDLVVITGSLFLVGEARALLVAGS